MDRVPADLYRRWRDESPGWLALRETPPGHPPAERFLQQLWRHQRLKRAALRTLDGRPLTVLHPGFWNREAGPDFRDAVLRFGDEGPVTGDVEIDLSASGWTQHRHHVNPAYARVRLHAIWQASAPSPAMPLPTLVLADALDAPLEELRAWLGREAADPQPAGLLAGRCAPPFTELDDDQLAGLLTQAAGIRLERKASLLRARAREAGWEQALWEGLFTALGYKHNAWPMRRLGELRPQVAAGPADCPASPLTLEARLLGLSGLLPAELPRAGGAAQSHLRALWDVWWRERDAFASFLLPRVLWRLNGVRPANHPQRRLALAAHWLADPGWLGRIERWATASVAPETLLTSLLDQMQPAATDGFWARHWTLRSSALPQPHPLLGAPRGTDLAVNVILPWLWSRADAGQNAALRARLQERYFAWPAAEDNTVLRLARARLWGGARRRLPRTAAMQQGLLQIVRDFCDHTNALCVDCRFPDLLGGLSRTGSGSQAPAASA